MAYGSLDCPYPGDIVEPGLSCEGGSHTLFDLKGFSDARALSFAKTLPPEIPSKKKT